MRLSEGSAAYKLVISLENDQSRNHHWGDLRRYYPGGNTQAIVTLTLASISGITSTDLAPIVAFQLYLVGSVNGESAALAWRVAPTASNRLTQSFV